jgi:hypothetical protein
LLLTAPGSGRLQRARVVVVLADAGGLSFRDAADAEVVRIDAGRILSIELASLAQRRPVRPAVVTTIDGAFEFTVGLTPDQLVDAVVALRTALGRAAG